jgi:hypothetical protein
MPDGLDSAHPRLPVSNYGSAVARALEWLGDRYLLAKPINASTQRRASAAATRHPQERDEQEHLSSREA